MREIKFRGKAKDLPITSGFVFGYYLIDEQHDKPRHCIWTREFNGVGIANNIIEVDPASVGQYTGLKDENGVEIYEGDILQGPYPHDENYYAVIEVDNEGSYNFYLVTLKRPGANCRGISDGIGEIFEDAIRMEIVGNIWEDGNLLKGGNCDDY